MISQVLTHRQLQQGGLLLEALIGFVLLSLLILGLVPSQIAIQSHQHLGQDLTQATMLAESEIERLQALPWRALPPDGQEKIFSQALANSSTHFDVTREIETSPVGWRRIMLKVNWTDLSGTHRNMQWESGRSFEPEGWGAKILSSQWAHSLPESDSKSQQPHPEGYGYLHKPENVEQPGHMPPN